MFEEILRYSEKISKKIWEIFLPGQSRKSSFFIQIFINFLLQIVEKEMEKKIYHENVI